MACPYFYPLAPRTSLGSPKNAMLPLGDFWTGECRANLPHPCQAEEADLRSLCNLGYARHQCVHFPPLPEVPDAVRFTVSGEDASHLRLYYVIERDHHPFAHGPLEYSTTLGAFTSLPVRENFERQARAYVESYYRHKTEAASA
jgi:hypothetical protein